MTTTKNRSLVQCCFAVGRVTATAVATALLSACGGGITAQEAATLKSEAADLRSGVATLQIKVAVLERQLDELVNDELLRKAEGVAYLTPGSNGYSTARSDFGLLTFKLEDVQAFANGTKITLKIGNPLSATLNGLSAEIQWGGVDPKSRLPNEELPGGSRAVKFAEPVRAGAWTMAQVVLEGASPADIGFIRVRDVAHTGIGLSTRK